MSISSTVPDNLKAIKAYLLRAEELDKAHDDKARLVAYHCRSYAIELGLTLNDKSQESSNCLMQIMQRLEADKPSLPANVSTLEDKKNVVTNFALMVFSGADKHDREGKSDKETAKSFYAAASFLEILKQFSPTKELDKDTKDKVVYAKWRATEIVKAIKEGRTPDPPPDVESDNNEQVEDKDDELPSVPGSQAHLEKQASMIAKAQQEAAAAAAATSSSSSVPKPSATSATPASANGSKSRTLSDHDDGKPTSMAFGKPVKSLNKVKRLDAIEYGKYALKAVETDEIDLAIQYFKKALEILHE